MNRRETVAAATNDRPPFPVPPRLVLASVSPRRASLMREHGYEVEIAVPPVDEPADLPGSLSPVELAEALSFFKARSVAATRVHGWVLAGDTIVSMCGAVFGKSADRRDARRILSALSGTTHQVITGVTLLDAATGRRQIAHDLTGVTMKKLSPAEIEAYLDSGEWQGKAGAYGIQDCGDAFVTRLDGSFTNVVGFPMELVERMLRAWGWLRAKP
jgi:septum formation protein